MKNKLFIYLDTPEQVAWLLCDATGNIVHTLTQSTLADLTTIAATAEVIVVVPATDVLLTTVELPQLNKKQLINAIPYALEEHLLHEPTEYFFAVPENIRQAKLPVAVVRQTVMQQWINWLQQAQIMPERLFPAVFALEVLPQEWHAYIENEMAVVRTGIVSGFAVDTLNLMPLLLTELQQATLHIPQKIIVDQRDKAILELPTMAVAVEINNQPLTLLEQAVQTCWQTQPINLLQQQYQVVPQSTRAEKIWRTAVILALATLLLTITFTLIKYFYLSQQSQQLQSQISTIITEHFAGNQMPDDPTAKLKAKLERMQTAASGGEFLQLLAKAGPIFQANRLPFLSLDFANNQLRVRFPASVAAQVANVKKHLSSAGLKVQQASINQQIELTISR